MTKRTKLIIGFTTLALTLGTITTAILLKPGIEEASNDPFNDKGAVLLNEARLATKGLTKEENYVPEGFVHTTIKSDTKYIRYAFAVDGVDIEKLTVVRTVDNNTLRSELKTVYKKIAIGDKEYFYDPLVDGKLSEKDPGNGFYFGCYCIQLQEESVNKKIGVSVEAGYDGAGTVVAPVTQTTYTVASDVDSQVTAQFVDLNEEIIEKQIILSGDNVIAPNYSEGNFKCWVAGGNVWNSGSVVYEDTIIKAHACKTSDIEKVNGKAPTCTEDGWMDYFECKVCKSNYKDSTGTQEILNLEAWKLGEGKLEKAGHKLVKIPGKIETCETNGYEDAYYCEDCETYFEDELGVTKIGDKDAYDAWIAVGGDGFIPMHAHSGQHVDGQAKDACRADGYDESWKCSECNNYFSDEACAKKIGDAEAYAAWKVGDGKIAKDAHKPGNLIPEVDAHRDTDGMKAHKKCKVCDCLLDEEGNETTTDALKIPNRVFEWAAGEGTYDELSHVYKDGELFIFDVKLDAGSQLKFTIYAENWGTRSIDCNVYENGTNDEPTFVKSCPTDDGWIRVTVDPSCVRRWEDYDPESQHEEFRVKDQFKYFRVQPGSTGSGKIELEPSFEAHNYGDWINQVEPHRDTAGTLGHYHCSVCERNFDADHNEIKDISFIYQTTVVPNTNASIKLKKAYDTTKDVFTVDFKITDVADDTKISVRLYNSAVGYDPYIGYFNFTKNLSDAPWGGVKKSITCDDYVRLEFDLKNITMYGEDGKPSTIDSIQVRGVWTTANAVIEPEADYVQHESLTYVDEVKPFRNEPGMVAHYECEDCGRYFDTDKNEVSAESLNIASRLYSINSGDAEQSFDFACGVNDTINLEVKVDDPSGSIYIGFRYKGSNWKRTTNIKLYANGTVEYTDKVGTKSLQGATVLGKTDDGYWRLRVDLSNIDKEDGFLSVSQVVIYKWNHSAGMIDINPAPKAPIVMASGEFSNGKTYDIKKTIIPAKSGKIVATFDFGEVTANVKTHFMFGDGWSNFYGYFGVWNNGNLTATFSGVTSRLVLTNIVEVTFDLAAITTVGGNIDLINVLNLFYFHPSWGTATGGQVEVLYYAA